MPATYLALLRGINVGGENKLPIKELSALFTEVGCVGVQTHIQSGNVLFEASSEIAETLPTQIAMLIAERFGLRVPVVLQTADQLTQTLRSNPFLVQGLPEEARHVMFLADIPAPDALAVRGRDIYLYLPNSVADTKLLELMGRGWQKTRRWKEPGIEMPGYCWTKVCLRHYCVSAPRLDAKYCRLLSMPAKAVIRRLRPTAQEFIPMLLMPPASYTSCSSFYP